jgi:hypothetical protein
MSKMQALNTLKGVVQEAIADKEFYNFMQEILYLSYVQNKMNDLLEVLKVAEE